MVGDETEMRRVGMPLPLSLPKEGVWLVMSEERRQMGCERSQVRIHEVRREKWWELGMEGRRGRPSCVPSRGVPGGVS